MNLLDFGRVPESLAQMPGRVRELWDDTEPDEGLKQCHTCHLFLPFEDFPLLVTKGVTYYRSQCKGCYRAYAAALYHVNKNKSLHAG